MRAALASCDATVIAIEAAREGVELTRLEVDVSSETDMRGTLGVKDVEAGPVAMRVKIVVASDNATEEQFDAPVVYGSGRDGYMMRKLTDQRENMRPLFALWGGPERDP